MSPSNLGLIWLLLIAFVIGFVAGMSVDNCQDEREISALVDGRVTYERLCVVDTWTEET